MRKRTLFFSLPVLFIGCQTAAFQDKVYVLDAPKGNLRGHASDGSDDRQLSDCDPQPAPSPSVGLRYRCVVHFNADYKAVLNEINRLEQALIACQQGLR